MISVKIGEEVKAASVGVKEPAVIHQTCLKGTRRIGALELRSPSVWVRVLERLGRRPACAWPGVHPQHTCTHTHRTDFSICLFTFSNSTHHTEFEPVS